MLDKRVSIIVPVYNVEAYMEECMKSIIEQTYENLEILIIDDGSKDNSIDICRKFAERDLRIKIISQENMGVSAARNNGLRNATGEYITFVDSDDTIEADYIETLVSACKDKTDVVCCNVPDTLKKLDETVTGFTDMAFVFSEFGYAWGKLIKRSSICDFFDEDVCYAEDFLFYIVNMRNFSELKILDYEGYHYRIRVGSLSVKDKSEAHTRREFENKYTVVNGMANVESRIKQFDKKTLLMVENHYYYMLTSLMLLQYRLHKNGIEIEKEKVRIVQKMMKKCVSSFFCITLLKRKNIKRFLYGIMLYLMPGFGARIADELLK